MNKKRALIASGALVIAALAVVYYLHVAAPGGGKAAEQFTVPLGTDAATAIANLEHRGFIKSVGTFSFFLGLRGGAIATGGYIFSKDMNAWEAAGVVARGPTMQWVVIPEGLRKEEIAGLLAEGLGWSEATKKEFIAFTDAAPENYTEGVYFPDTYLIPQDEVPGDVALRMRRRFEEQFAPHAEEAIKQNIRWPTLIKVASLVQREAAGEGDMPLIAGVIWNRLLDGMKLDIDATVQYARGDVGKGFWSPIGAAEKEIDSPYNTYKYKGLPPTPIANPGNDAIRAALFPEKTRCFYYLHDPEGGIHCAATFEEHRANIAKYL